MDIIHPVYGKGFRLWEFRGFFEDHYPQYPPCRVIQYVCKTDKVAYVSLFIPACDQDGDHWKPWIEVRSMNWLSRAAAAKSAAGPRETEVVADAFAEKFPATFAFMAATTNEGKPRELCKVQVFADQGVWKAALHDPNTEASLFVTLGGPMDAFKSIEKALTAETPDWRSWGRKGPAKRK